jgi:hypothetical protein
MTATVHTFATCIIPAPRHFQTAFSFVDGSHAFLIAHTSPFISVLLALVDFSGEHEHLAICHRFDSGVDEADRMVSQGSFRNWVAILDADAGHNPMDEDDGGRRCCGDEETTRMLKPSACLVCRVFPEEAHEIC